MIFLFESAFIWLHLQRVKVQVTMCELWPYCFCPCNCLLSDMSGESALGKLQNDISKVWSWTNQLTYPISVQVETLGSTIVSVGKHLWQCFIKRTTSRSNWFWFMTLYFNFLIFISNDTIPIALSPRQIWRPGNHESVGVKLTHFKKLFQLKTVGGVT